MGSLKRCFSNCTTFYDNHVFIEAGKILEDLDVSAITLHPRTTLQKFSGTANITIAVAKINAFLSLDFLSIMSSFFISC